MINWPKTLVQEIAERRTIIFIGSGISKVAHPDLPTWEALLKQLSFSLSTNKDQKLVNKLVRQGRLLDAAEIIKSQLDDAVLSHNLEDIFDVKPKPKSEIYNDLLHIDPKTIVTTNYDEFIEDNFRHFSGGEASHRVRKYDFANLLSDLRSPTRSILKIHGCITHPESVVLDRTSYFSSKAKNLGFFQVLSALMTVNTVLFLGYSISDPDIQLILENMNHLNSTDRPHYAMVSKMDHPSLRDAVKKTYNVEILEYPKGQYEQVPDSIKYLKEVVKQARAERGIP